MSVIALDHVSKRYVSGSHELYAVRDVNLSIEPGEFVAVMGPSGSGKSTMMHLMGLLDLPTEGTVRIEQQITTGLSDRELARVRNEKLGFVFQSFNLLARTSVIDNVALPLWYARVPTSKARAAAVQALRHVGLDPELQGMKRPNELSGGQQQRVAIARAIVTRPAVLLADEPTGNLDSAATAEVLACFQALNREGTTIVMVTHEDDVARHAQRIIRFRDGRVEADEKVAQPRIAAAEVKV